MIIIILLMFATFFWFFVYVFGKIKKRRDVKAVLNYNLQKESDIEKSKHDKEHAIKTLDSIYKAIEYNNLMITQAKSIEERNFLLGVEDELEDYKNAIIEVM